MTDRVLTAGHLTVDLGRIRANYRTIDRHLDGATIAAMVKANGYGLGAVEVAQALTVEGCRIFFVAHLSEGIELRQALPDVEVQVLNGAMPGTEHDLVGERLIPVLNSLEQLHVWSALATERADGRSLPATLHLDTGMSRLGLPPDEIERLRADPSLLDGVRIDHVMSHLASADVPGSVQSDNQLERFQGFRRSFPGGTASLANSAGVFLGDRFHFDLVRPGIALYGGNPTPGEDNPMTSVVTLEVPILQLRVVDSGETVGYGATHLAEQPERVATVGTGYADGFLRSASGVGEAAIAGRKVPIIGRISMDLITLDVSSIPERYLYLGAPVELIGPNCLVDDVASRAGSIANEVLTDLGSRYRVTYVDDGASS